MAMFRTEDFQTPVGRGSFLQNLFIARKQGTDANAKEKFGATLIFPKSLLREKVCKKFVKMENNKPVYELTSLEAMVAEAITGEWGEKGLARAKSGLIKSPFLAGDGKEARNKETGELHPGMGSDVVFIRMTANADRPPKVFSVETGQRLPATKEDAYSGCYGYAIVNAFCWNNAQNGDGVSIGISMFFKTADGEPLGGSGAAGNPDVWTESLPDTGDAPASTKSGAGASALFGD